MYFLQISGAKIFKLEELEMKKTVLKTLSLTLCIIMMLSVICVSAESYVTLYAENGRSKAFPSSQVEAQLTVGWYREPVRM